MAKYIAKYNSEGDAMMALAKGELASPYVVSIPSGETYAVLYDGSIVVPSEYYAEATVTTTGDSQSVLIILDGQLSNVSALYVDGVAVTSEAVPGGYYTFENAGKHNIFAFLSGGTLNTIFEHSEIETIVLSSSVTAIANYALQNCYKLTSINAPGITSFGRQSIENCSALTKFDAVNVTYAGRQAMSGCYAMTSINFPNLETIEQKCFQFCSGITSFNGLENVQTIGNNALRGTNIPVINFGSGLTSWDYNVLNACSSTTEVNFAEDSVLTSLNSFGDNMWSLTEIVFPDSIQTYCQDSMQYGLIMSASAMTSVTFGTGATTFQGLVLGGNMPNLTSITCLAETAPTLSYAGNGVFNGVTANTGTLYVPRDSDYSGWLIELGENWSVSYLPGPSKATLSQTSQAWQGASGEITVVIGNDADSWELSSSTAFFPAYEYAHSVTGNTNATVYVQTDVNQGAYQQWHSIYVTFYLNGNVVSTSTLEMVQQPQPQSVHIIETFNVTSTTATYLVPEGDGMDGHIGQALLDGAQWINVVTGQYQFDTTGTHTLEYIRESSDTYLQGWLQNSDAVSIYASGTTTWGCHGNQYYGQNTSMVFSNNIHLTSIEFDANMDRIGSSCFSGDTSLVEIKFRNPNGVSFEGTAYPFDTITANIGTLHIPSGTTSAYSDIITALGTNWTVVDDL